MEPHEMKRTMERVKPFWKYLDDLRSLVEEAPAVSQLKKELEASIAGLQAEEARLTELVAGLKTAVTKYTRLDREAKEAYQLTALQHQADHKRAQEGYNKEMADLMDRLNNQRVAAEQHHEHRMAELARDKAVAEHALADAQENYRKFREQFK